MLVAEDCAALVVAEVATGKVMLGVVDVKLGTIVEVMFVDAENEMAPKDDEDLIAV